MARQQAQPSLSFWCPLLQPAWHTCRVNKELIYCGLQIRHLRIHNASSYCRPKSLIILIMNISPAAAQIT